MGNVIRAVVLLSLCSIAVSAAHADKRWSRHGKDHFDYAKVTGVQPIYRVVEVRTPREVCWDEPVARRVHSSYGRPQSATPLILGGILGGVVGNQFGGGNGQTAMTVAGTLLGASLGRDAAYRRQGSRYSGARTVYASERRCEIEEVARQEERLEGYRVTYRYQGREYVTRTDHDPGARIRVRVAVDPVVPGA